MLLVLEDDPSRCQRFQHVLRVIAPGMPLRIWRDAHIMIRDLPSLLAAAAAISLDHDLNQLPGQPDPGDGYLVAQWLTSQPVVRPVVIHSSNGDRSLWMAGAFDLAGWSHHRVLPFGEDWVETEWRQVMTDLLHDQKAG